VLCALPVNFFFLYCVGWDIKLYSLIRFRCPSTPCSKISGTKTSVRCSSGISLAIWKMFGYWCKNKMHCCYYPPYVTPLFVVNSSLTSPMTSWPVCCLH